MDKIMAKSIDWYSTMAAEWAKELDRNTTHGVIYSKSRRGGRPHTTQGVWGQIVNPRRTLERDMLKAIKKVLKKPSKPVYNQALHDQLLSPKFTNR